MSSLDQYSSDERLGTLEFTAALNGADPLLAISVLKRFVKIVRKERILALTDLLNDGPNPECPKSGNGALDGSFHSDDDSDEVDNTLDEEQTSPPPSKKAKLESWKLDTKQYNVPFVGTSVNKGTSGTIEKNTWPTGFLASYLQQSPNAAELLGEGGKKEQNSPFLPPHGEFHKTLLRGNNINKASRAKSALLYKLYVQAVGEIVTCGFPIDVARKETIKDYSFQGKYQLNYFDGVRQHNEKRTMVQDGYKQIISSVMKEQMAPLLSMIDAEMIDSNENYDSKISSGKSVGNTETIVAILNTLSKLSSTSTGAAREVTRGLDTFLKEGTLARLLNRQINCLRNGEGEECGTVLSKENTRRTRKNMKVRSACLQLSSVLLELDDSVITSNIISSGKKQSKLRPGIAYLSLRTALTQRYLMDVMKEDREGDRELKYGEEEEYVRAVLRLLCTFKNHFLSPPDRTYDGVAKRETIDTRPMIEMFRGNVIEGMIRLSSFAQEYYNDNEMSSIVKVARECHELVQSFLSDTTNSPFLRIMSGDGDDGVVSSAIHQLIRCIHLLVSLNPSMTTRTFIVECVNKTPSLLPAYFRTLSLPEPKATFSCIASYSFITYLLHNVGKTWLCVEKDRSSVITKSTTKGEQVLIHIIPKALTKNILTKAIQSSNLFLLSETLKLVIAVIKRAQNFLSSHQKLGLQNDMKGWLLRRLPDLQVVLSARSRYDPFIKERSSSNMSRNLLTMLFYEVLISYSSTFQSTITSIQFDWVKILPDSSDAFLSSPKSLQYRSLLTLNAVYDSYNVKGSQANTMATPKAVNIFASILIETDSPVIYNLTRNLAIKSVSSIIGMNVVLEKEIHNNLEYEISLWVDGITDQTKSLFCRLLESAQKLTVQHETLVTHAWLSFFPTKEIESTKTSPLLSLAIIGIASDISSLSEPFVILTMKIVMKMLMYNRSPLSLSCLLCKVLASYSPTDTFAVGKGHKAICTVQSYAESLISDGKGKYVQAIQVSALLFGEGHFHSEVASMALTAKNQCEEEMIMHTIADKDKSLIMNQLDQSLQLLSFLKRDNMCTKPIESKITLLIIVALQNYIEEGKIVGIAESLSENYSTVTSYIWSIMLLRHPEVTASSLKHICGKVSLSLLNSLQEDKISSNAKAQLAVNAGVVTLSQSYQNVLLLPILQHCNKLEKGGKVLAILALMLKVLKKKDVPEKIWKNTLTIEAVFNVWSFISSTNGICGFEEVYAPLQHCLENAMANVLLKSEHYGIASSHLFRMIYQSSTEDIATLALKTASDRQVTLSVDESPFLCALIKYDVSAFGTITLKNIDNHFRANLTFDMVAATLIREVLKKKLVSISSTKAFVNLTVWLNGRIFDHMRRIIHDNAMPEVLFENMMQALQALLHEGLQSKKDQKEFLFTSESFLEALREKGKSKSLKSYENIYLSSICETSSALESSLANVLFTHISQILPRHLKKKQPDSAFLLAKALDFFDQIELLNMEESSLLKLKGMVVTCLKYGLNLDYRESLSTLCLRVVRHFVNLTSQSICNTSKVALFSPGQIFAMITSHSNFEVLAAARDSDRREELISLLIRCFTLDDGEIEIAINDTIHNLMKGFDAGLGKSALLLRRLLVIIEDKFGHHEDFSLHSHELMWGRSATSSFQIENEILGTDHGLQWEWFLKELDMSRIRLTLSDFPVWDVAKPTSDINAQSLKVTDLDGTTGNFFSSQEGSISHDHDERYSPGFVLPLILGVLESFCFKAKGSSDHLEGNDEQNKFLSKKIDDKVELHDDVNQLWRDSFAKVAFRLSQKGAIALAISSLSSKCPEIRQVAVAILYFFLQALGTKEAHDISAWRERPQIKMLINSIQRGLTVRRAIKDSRVEDDTSHDASQSEYVPMFPTVSSLFLARSYFILSKPGDDMYSPINRFFLRLDDHHGAYGDCFSLPAFVSLYCSNADDVVQARKERSWALQFLHDGIVDDYCYQVASRRHASELLLTSLDSSLSRDKAIGNHEILLLFRTINKMMEMGGMSSYYHLVHTVGIFAWLQGTAHTLLRRTGKASLLLESYFSILQTTLKKSLQVYRNADSETVRPTVDICKIAQNVVKLFLMIPRPRSTLLISSISEILWSLRQWLYLEGGGHGETYLNPSGISLDSALEVLQELESHSLSSKALKALCLIPLDSSCECEENSIVSFCALALKSILESDGILSDDSGETNIFQRVSMLTRRYNLSSQKAGLLIELALGARHKATENKAIFSSWQQCISSFSGLIDDDSEDYEYDIRSQIQFLKETVPVFE